MRRCRMENTHAAARRCAIGGARAATWSKGQGARRLITVLNIIPSKQTQQSHQDMCRNRSGRITALVATLTIALLCSVAIAAHDVHVTPDNSVILANALGRRESFDAVEAQPICLIKIHSIRSEPVEDGVHFVYEVEGCEVNEFRGFGVCKNGGCHVRAYHVRLFAPTGAGSARLDDVWQV